MIRRIDRANPSSSKSAHIHDVDAPVFQEAALVGVDRADAEEMHVGRVDNRLRLAVEQGLEARLAAQHRDRHAVHVARGRGRRRVVVRMGVEPQDEQLAPCLGGVARHSGDRPHRQAVVAAEHQRQPPLAQDRMGLAREVACPGGDFREMARPAFGRARVAGGMAGSEVAEVHDLVPELAERPDDPRRAQHRRTHRAARDSAPASIGAPMTVIACRRWRPSPAAPASLSIGSVMLVPLSARVSGVRFRRNALTTLRACPMETP